MQAVLLGLFFPLTIWAAPWWKRIIVGKDDVLASSNVVILPDGTSCQVWCVCVCVLGCVKSWFVVDYRSKCMMPKSLPCVSPAAAPSYEILCVALLAAFAMLHSIISLIL